MSEHETDYQPIDKETFQTCARQYGALKRSMDETRGEIGALVKDFEDTRGIHRKAFKDVWKLNNMEPTAAESYLRSFIEYCVHAGLLVDVPSSIFPQLDLFDTDVGEVEAAEDGESDEPEAEAPEEEPQAEDPRPSEQQESDEIEGVEPEAKPKRGRKRKAAGNGASASVH